MPFRPFIPARDFHVYSPFTQAVRAVLDEGRAPFALPAKISMRFDDAVQTCRLNKRVPVKQAYWMTMRQIAWQGKSTDFDHHIKAQERRFHHAQIQSIDAYRKTLPFYKYMDGYALEPESFRAPYAAKGQKVLMRADWDNACVTSVAAQMLQSWAKHPKATPLQAGLGQSAYNYALKR